MSDTTTTKWWQGTNFYIAAIMVVGGLWSTIQQEDVSTIVMGIFGVISAGGMIREKVKGTKPIAVKEWLSSKNTWNYIAIAATQILPNIPGELFDRLNEIATATINKNWTALISALLSGATIVYFWLRGNATPK